MDFSLSDEQRLLKDSAERLIRTDYPIDVRREIVAGEDGYSKNIWATFAELGWLALPFSEADGGLGGGADDVMVLMEELGRGIVVEPYMPTVLLAGGLIAAAGGDTLKEETLPGVIAGETQLALTHSERQARFTLSDVATTARRDGGGFLLSGAKAVAFNGAQADRILISARTSGDRRDTSGISLFILDPKTDGVTVRGYRTVDGLRAADFRLDKARLPSTALLGGEGEALPVLEEAIDRATAAVCAEALGIMSVMYEMTLDYARSRKQFGRPIGAFQTIQHRLVEMFMACEESRSLVYRATLSLDLPRAERMRAVSAAKVQIGRAGRHVGQEAIQIHGGMGMTDELAISHYFKRLTMIDTLFGDVDHHLSRYISVSHQ